MAKLRHSSWLACAIVTSMVAIASAHPEQDAVTDTKPSLGDQILPPPPTYKANGVTVDEKLGAQLPMDATFRTAEGKTVKLSDVIAGDLPTILTFNYSDCPMLCSVQLNGLTATMQKTSEPFTKDGKSIALRVGEQFRLVTIDLEPNESLDKLGKLRDRYIARLPAEQQGRARAGGWTFLVANTPGNGDEIKRVADTVGFKYSYVTERAEWAHPASIMFLSAAGKVTRYVYGIDFPADVMRESILAAGTAEPKAAVGFMLRCYHYDPGANDHSRAGVTALRVGAAGFVVLLVAGLGVIRFRRNRSEAQKS